MLRWLRQWLLKKQLADQQALFKRYEERISELKDNLFEVKVELYHAKRLPEQLLNGKVEYNAEEIGSISVFLNNPIGQRFLSDLCDKQDQNMRWAMMQEANWENACGYARGYGACVDYIRQFASQQISTEAEEQGRPSLRELLSP